MKLWWLGCLFFVGCQQEVSSRRVVATVAGAPIYEDDFEREFHRIRVGSAEGLPDDSANEVQKEQLLQDLITRRLVLNEAEAKNIIVSIDEVDALQARIKGGWEPERFAGELRELDLTPNELRQQLREMLTIQRYYKDQVFSRVAVTERDIESYMRKHPELATIPERVKASQIVLRTRERPKKFWGNYAKACRFAKQP